MKDVDHMHRKHVENIHCLSVCKNSVAEMTQMTAQKKYIHDYVATHGIIYNNRNEWVIH